MISEVEQRMTDFDWFGVDEGGHDSTRLKGIF
jgi:hypothetical protein